MLPPYSKRMAFLQLCMVFSLTPRWWCELGSGADVAQGNQQRLPNQPSFDDGSS
jgi:hypothetical protein